MKADGEIRAMAQTDLLDHRDAVDRSNRAGEFVSRTARLWRRFPMAPIGLLSLIDQAIVSATSFATAIVVTRTLSRDDAGLYFLVLSVSIIALGFQENLISNPYTIYSKRRAGRELAEYAASAWVQHAALWAVGVLCLLAAIAVDTFSDHSQIVPGLWALAGAGPLILLREAIRRFSFVNLQVKAVIAIDCFVSATQLLGLLLLAWAGHLSILTTYAVMGGACALAACGWYLFARQKVRFDPARFLSDWRINWAFGKWALRSYLVGNTMPYIMPWVLSFYAGTAAAGVLGACTTLVGVSNIMVIGVDRVLAPRAAQSIVSGGPDELRQVLSQAALFLLLALGSFWVVLCAAGSQVAALVYGERFSESGPILAALGANALLMGLGMVVGNGLWTLEEPRANFVADVCGLAVTIPLAIYLVGDRGEFGAALALAAGAAVALAVRVAMLTRALSARQGLLMQALD